MGPRLRDSDIGPGPRAIGPGPRDPLAELLEDLPGRAGRAQTLRLQWFQSVQATGRVRKNLRLVGGWATLENYTQTKDDSHVYVMISTPSCQLPVTCVAGAGNRSAKVVAVAETRKL